MQEVWAEEGILDPLTVRLPLRMMNRRPLDKRKAVYHERPLKEGQYDEALRITEKVEGSLRKNWQKWT